MAACSAQAPSKPDFSVDFVIPDGLPFPYEALNRSGSHGFTDGVCEWLDTGTGSTSVSGTIYRAGTNGSTHVEGDITVQGTDSLICAAAGCPESITAYLRFNLPL